MGVISRLAPGCCRAFAPVLAVFCALLIAAASTASAQVVINEVMASNALAVQNEGIYPDWVELFNTGASPVNISDWSLSDSAATPRKFVFPANTTIPGRGYLIVWCDGLTTASGFHASDRKST